MKSTYPNFISFMCFTTDNIIFLHSKKIQNKLFFCLHPPLEKISAYKKLTEEKTRKLIRSRLSNVKSWILFWKLSHGFYPFCHSNNDVGVVVGILVGYTSMQLKILQRKLEHHASKIS